MDHQPTPRLRVAFRIGAVLAALLLLGLAALWQQRDLAAQREALTAQVAAEHAAYLAQDDRRPVLYGTAQPGNAWECYAEALRVAAAPGLTLRETALEEVLQGTRSATAAELAAWQPALQLLRDGAHRQRARSLVDLRAGYDAALPDAMATLDLGRAALVVGRDRLASGAARAGLEALLDGLTYAIDLTRSPVLLEQMLGTVLVHATCTLGFADTVLAGLDRSDQELLAEALASADAQLPTTASIQGEALLSGSMLLDFKPEGQLPGLSIWHTWRHGFSERRLAYDALQQLRQLAQSVADDRSPDWPQREARLRELGDTIRRGDNVLLRYFTVNYLDAERELRRGVADLRLLRLCVAERLGQHLELVDPLGSGNLQRTTAAAVGGPTMQFASVGTSSERVLVRTVVK